MQDSPLLKTWQFFSAGRRILGDTFFRTVYNKGECRFGGGKCPACGQNVPEERYGQIEMMSQHQIYRWAADPDTTEYCERNPIDRLATVMERFVEKGRPDIPLSIISYLLKKISNEYRIINTGKGVSPDKPTIEAECMDDYPAVVKAHKQAQSGTDKDKINYAFDKALEELEETRAKVLRDRFGDEGRMA